MTTQAHQPAQATWINTRTLREQTPVRGCCMHQMAIQA
jgi:hypothetical protein